MSPEQLQVASLVLQGLILPGMYIVGSFLWKLDRRVLRVEIRLGIKENSHES